MRFNIRIGDQLFEDNSNNFNGHIYMPTAYFSVNADKYNRRPTDDPAVDVMNIEHVNRVVFIFQTLETSPFYRIDLHETPARSVEPREALPTDYNYKIYLFPRK